MAHSRKRRISKKIMNLLSLSSIQLKIYPLSVENKFPDIDLVRINKLRSLFPLNLTKEVNWTRFGSRFDGGYLLVDDISKSDVCISLGVGDNISFDIDISKRCQDVMMFDHTVEEPEFSALNINFKKIGISSIPRSGFTTLEQIIETIPIEVDLILKIDIEGTEWDVFDAISEKYLSRFRQIVVEFHDLFQIGNLTLFNKIVNSLTKLSKTHHLMNFHANNWADFHLILGIPLPDVIEVTYLRREPESASSHQIVPLNRLLNAPNNPNLPEFAPNFFTFVEI